MKLKKLKPLAVTDVPEKLKKGVLYICLECDVAVHLCPCGCGEKVVVIIAPDQWKLKFNGSNVTIFPSIGNSYFKCRSHYYIRDNRVIWLRKMPKTNTDERLSCNFAYVCSRIRYALKKTITYLKQKVKI